MAIPYPDDSQEFRTDLRAARLADFIVTTKDIDKIADVLVCSRQHARNMLSGWNRYSKPMRAKMNALIDSEYEPVASEPVVEGNYVYTEHLVVRFNEPVDLPSNNKFAVIDATDGTAVIIEIVAPFRDHTMARKLCQKLNDES